MAEDKKKVSSGSYTPQSAVTIGRNKRLKGERHAKRMAEQAAKGKTTARGMARRLRRAAEGLSAKWLAHRDS